MKAESADNGDGDYAAQLRLLLAQLDGLATAIDDVSLDWLMRFRIHKRDGERDDLIEKPRNSN